MGKLSWRGLPAIISVMRANFHQRPAALEESGRQPHNVITKITLFVNVCLSKSVLARESGLRLRLARSAGHQSPRSYKRGQYHKYRPRSFWYWPVVFQASFLMHIPQDEYLRHRSYGHPFDRRLHYRLSSRAVIETLLILMNLIIHQTYQTRKTQERCNRSSTTRSDSRFRIKPIIVGLPGRISVDEHSVTGSGRPSLRIHSVNFTYSQTLRQVNELVSPRDSLVQKPSTCCLIIAIVNYLTLSVAWEIH
ncbi:unnamed protein product [Nesidiocoris tenuis]|uniref:Uncharacterized protein n=1 Tax=Nesidiocoris tenuis TaxID=355587 RepID=A0A6H5G3Y7_9HEMI|nr:unnamed protein product [Nesidiocoris tenuis]